jgi:hypothetical protein
MSSHVVAVTRTIPVDAQRIFDLIADPANHPLIDGSGTVKATNGDVPTRLALGTKFGMSMKAGAPYKISNTVSEFEEGRLIGWHHFHGHVWRYILEPVEGGTKVTEQFDWTKAKSRLAIVLSRFPDRNRKAMERTLERIEEHFAAQPAV